MQSEVLSKHDVPDVRVYMVWVPKLRGLERDVPSATIQFPDLRAEHYWDRPSVLINGYRETLNLPEDAWDVFLLYDRNAKWEGDRPPAPTYWAHQLGNKEKPRVDGPWLDGEVFLAKLKALRALP
ncbi:MAG TPA: hypothetical protein VH740_15370 [Vicinamibacterales bacterium]